MNFGLAGYFTSKVQRESHY